MLIPVVLCGGSGTRLWPISRKLSPKQFIQFQNGRTLFGETLKRIKALTVDRSDPLIVTSDNLLVYVSNELKKASQHADIIIEPISRGTAPAIAVAAFQALAECEDAMLLVMPSDHVIGDNESFDKALKEGLKIAKEGYLVTFGVVPTYAETGFGYIKYGESLGEESYKIDKFVEKPCDELAAQMLKSKNYVWNSGIFLFRADSYVKELEKFEPQIYQVTQQICSELTKKTQIFNIEKKLYERICEISIDYAVMEKTNQAAVVSFDAKWSDLGSWESLYKNSEHDSQGNVLHGDVVSIDTRNCLMHSTDRLITAVGLDEMAVIETSDAVLVTPLRRSQEVKEIVKRLQSNDRNEVKAGRQVYRPWGYYESILQDRRYQVKKIFVQPGEELSLQKHIHRSEHWVVVQGTAEIIVGEKIMLLCENESIYIPVGEVHQLKNPGRIELIVIEVQIGAYLGEDDIVRLKDKYQRV